MPGKNLMPFEAPAIQRVNCSMMAWAAIEMY